MRIFIVENKDIIRRDFHDITNLKSLEQELDEMYEFWSYDFLEAIEYIVKQSIGA